MMIHAKINRNLCETPKALNDAIRAVLKTPPRVFMSYNGEYQVLYDAKTGNVLGGGVWCVEVKRNVRHTFFRGYVHN